jgi:hypothetical protein
MVGFLRVTQPSSTASRAYKKGLRGLFYASESAAYRSAPEKETEKVEEKRG